MKISLKILGDSFCLPFRFENNKLCIFDQKVQITQHLVHIYENCELNKRQIHHF